MTGSRIILHHDRNTPASVRIRKIFALKGLQWGSCEIDGEVGGNGDVSSAAAILSGALGQPILQFEHRLWVSSLAVTDAIEALCPDPTLFPNGNRGMPLALSWWSDDFGGTTSPEQISAHAALIARQLADGRSFLQGSTPGLADVQAFAGLTAATAGKKDATPDLPDVVTAWQARMISLGEGDPTTVTPDAALATLAAATIPAGHGEQKIRIVATNGCAVSGALVTSGPDGHAVAVNAGAGPGAGRSVIVHFPAIGYSAEAL